MGGMQVFEWNLKKSINNGMRNAAYFDSIDPNFSDNQGTFEEKFKSAVSQHKGDHIQRIEEATNREITRENLPRIYATRLAYIQKVLNSKAFGRVDFNAEYRLISRDDLAEAFLNRDDLIGSIVQIDNYKHRYVSGITVGLGGDFYWNEKETDHLANSEFLTSSISAQVTRRFMGQECYTDQGFKEEVANYLAREFTAIPAFRIDANFDDFVTLMDDKNFIENKKKLMDAWRKIVRLFDRDQKEAQEWWEEFKKEVASGREAKKGLIENLQTMLGYYLATELGEECAVNLVELLNKSDLEALVGMDIGGAGKVTQLVGGATALAVYHGVCTHDRTKEGLEWVRNKLGDCAREILDLPPDRHRLARQIDFRWATDTP